MQRLNLASHQKLALAVPALELPTLAPQRHSYRVLPSLSPFNNPLLIKTCFLSQQVPAEVNHLDHFLK
jgi:hypothetical protein